MRACSRERGQSRYHTLLSHLQIAEVTERSPLVVKEIMDSNQCCCRVFAGKLCGCRRCMALWDACSMFVLATAAIPNCLSSNVQYLRAVYETWMPPWWAREQLNRVEDGPGSESDESQCSHTASDICYYEFCYDSAIARVCTVSDSPRLPRLPHVLPSPLSAGASLLSAPQLPATYLYLSASSFLMPPPSAKL